MATEVMEGRLLSVKLVARKSPRVQSANPDEVLKSRNRLDNFDLVFTYEAAEPGSIGEVITHG